MGAQVRSEKWLLQRILPLCRHGIHGTQHIGDDIFTVNVNMFILPIPGGGQENTSQCGKPDPDDGIRQPQTQREGDLSHGKTAASILVHDSTGPKLIPKHQIVKGSL